MNVAMLLSCGSFEWFYGRIQGQSRQSYLDHYRNDWACSYARDLLDNGIQPVLYIPSLYESGKYETDAGIPVRFLPLARWFRPLEQWSLTRLSRATRWSLYAAELLNSAAFIDPLRKALAADDIDLLYAQEYWGGRFDYLVRALDLPVVGADHGAVSKGTVQLFKSKTFETAALCYGQTESECRMIETYGGRSKLQPNGCDVSEFFPDPSVKRGKTVLTVARLTDKHKRTSDLIRAMAELPEEWTLDIVGAGPDRDMLERLVSDLGLSSRVTFHGFTDRATVRDLLRRCGVYAMPSSHEAVALAALEAMACGAAVVLSRIPTFEALVTDGLEGRLVAIGDVQGLSAAIVDAWNRREALGAAAFEKVRTRYNTRVLYSELAESLRACLPSSGLHHGQFPSELEAQPESTRSRSGEGGAEGGGVWLDR
jgi:glycosyltransferase involved in cell wall biosynthesis